MDDGRVRSPVSQQGCPNLLVSQISHRPFVGWQPAKRFTHLFTEIMKYTYLIRLLLAAILASLALSACGGGASGDSKPEMRCAP